MMRFEDSPDGEHEECELEEEDGEEQLERRLERPEQDNDRHQPPRHQVDTQRRLELPRLVGNTQDA